MVVDVGLDAAVLQGEELAFPALARSVHFGAVRALAGHGRLVFATESRRDDFLSAVSALPAGLEAIWKTAFEERRIELGIATVGSPCPVTDAATREVLRAEWRSVVDVLLLDEITREMLAYEVGDLPDSSGSPEMADLPSLALSRRLADARTALQRPLMPGERRSEQWRLRFLPVVRYTTRMSLYDKFAGAQMVEHARTKSARSGGVRWLAVEAAKSGVKRVAIYTSWTPTGDEKVSLDDIEEAARGIASQAGHGMTLSVIACRRDQVEHDRHLCFDNRVAAGLGRGVALFAEDPVTEISTLGELDASAARKRERTLEVLARRG